MMSGFRSALANRDNIGLRYGVNEIRQTICQTFFVSVFAALKQTYSLKSRFQLSGFRCQPTTVTLGT